MPSFLQTTAAALQTALQYMQADLVSYEGVVANCVASEKVSEMLVAGGFAEHFAGFVRVAKDGFPVPVKGSKILVNGTERRIVNYDEDPISYKIHLEHISR